MSISYEEALATLSAMFGPPWTQDSLDTVLRHYQGHMENTVDAILRHGDGDPQALIDTLMAGGKPEDATTSMDEQLARQLAQEERRRRQTRPTANNNNNRPPDPPAAPPTKQSRGTPTTLPADFLRIPGATVSTSTDNTTMDSDAALARMLQDELFSQELANNPEFAHLARGSPRTVGGRPTNVRAFSGSRMAASGHHIGEMPRRGYPGGSQPQGEGPNIMDRISDLGDAAKKRLANLATQFNESRRGAASSNTASASRTADGGVQETRGLLDDVEDDSQEMEMTFAGDRKKLE